MEKKSKKYKGIEIDKCCEECNPEYCLCDCHTQEVKEEVKEENKPNINEFYKTKTGFKKK